MELVVVVLILAILAAVAVPAIISNADDAEVNALMQQLNTIIDAAELYQASNGSWPQTTNYNSLPGDFEGILPARAFTDMAGASASTTGLTWLSWGYTDKSFVEVAFVHAHHVDTAIAPAVDEKFDDGDPAAGSIVYGPDDVSGVPSVQIEYTYILNIK